MSESEYDWAPGEEPPLIGDHSLAKHEVLARYLRTYVEVLTANPRMDRFRLTLVDGFAGGGVYTTERGELHSGSPLQMVHAMRDAEALAKSRRNKEFRLDVEFFFVESKARNVEVLRAALDLDPTARAYRQQGKIRILEGAFDVHCAEITRHIAGKGRVGRSIFLLDQYGYKDVPLRIIRDVLGRLQSAEFLLTFATDWLIDYMSEQGTVNIARLEKMGLRSMAEQFEQLLSRKHGDPSWRRYVQSVLHHDLVEQSGARYFTPFFILSPKAHREYWFLHLSRHARARDEMAKLHWLLQNRFAHYGRSGLGMLGSRLSRWSA